MSGDRLRIGEVAMRRALHGLVGDCACRDDGPMCPIIEALDDGVFKLTR
jgi:hypothetical protein